MASKKKKKQTLSNYSKHILAIDVGNTNIHLAVFKAGNILFHNEFSLRELKKENLFYEKVDKIIISKTNNKLEKKLESIYKVKIVHLNEIKQNKIKKTYKGLGADRICNLIAALNKLKGNKQNIVVFDFGTATTVTCCDKNGNFVGGLIKLGLHAELKAISQLIPSLPKVDLKSANKSHRLVKLANNPTDAIFYGVINGQLGFIDSFLKDFKGSKPKVFLTGGNAKFLSTFYKNFDVIDQRLTLEGMCLWGEGSLNTIS